MNPLLSHSVDLDTIRVVAEKKPDELAPQLSIIVRELLEDEAKHVRNYGLSFIKLTVLTETFREVLRELFTSLRNNNPYTAWLNLDMGSGKTHLLVLITYLIYCYKYLKEEAREYEALGLDENLAKETAVFPIDLRTPSEIPLTFLRFFAESLRRIGEHLAAEYLERCIRENRMPEASEIARSLVKINTKIIVLVDELHHAVLTYRSAQTERRWIRDVLEFVTSLINYMRHYRRGFAILVASARRDYERLNQISEKDELILLAENLISQIGRLKPALETKWLSVSEAREIILKRLGARWNILHDSFNGFIERVIKAESDIPQAQHLRSLIKAMAIYTLNAIEMGHSIVTPLAFSEKVIDALFPEGGGVADKYKSAYSHAKRVIKEYGEIERENIVVRDIAQLIVNAIFTASITGRSDLLIETIKAYKTGKSPRLLPAISEGEIENLLKTIGFKEPDRIINAFRIVEKINYIHSIKQGDIRIYFVVPVVSVVAVYNNDIDERFRAILRDRETLITGFVSYLHIPAGQVDRDSQVIVINSCRELEEVTKRLNPNIMYLVVCSDVELVKFLDEKIRTTPNIDVVKEINNWFQERTGYNIPRWIEEHRRFNIAVAIPVPYSDVLIDIAKYYAVEEATSRVINEYLLEFVKTNSSLQEDVKKLIEIELDEIHRVLSDKLTEALGLFVRAYSRALGNTIYLYKCRYKSTAEVICNAESTSTSTLSLGDVSIKHPAGIKVSRENYAVLINTLHSRRDEYVTNLLKKIIERIKNLANFVGDLMKAREVILHDILRNLRDILRGLRDTDKYGLSSDMNNYIQGSEILYIPPNIVKEVAKSITAEEIEKKIRELEGVEDITVVKREEGETVVFEARRKHSTVVKETVEKPQLLEEKRGVDYVAEVLKTLDSCDKGEIRIVLSFDKSSKPTVKTYVTALRKYIKEIEVKPS